MTLADQAAMNGHDGQLDSSKPERPKRRTFTAACKARILADYDALHAARAVPAGADLHLSPRGKAAPIHAPLTWRRLGRFRCMPHPYRRLNPALEEAVPDSRGATDGSSVRTADDIWEMLFGDGQWRNVTALAWWQDRHGRWVVQVRYHVHGEGRFTGLYVADPAKMREHDGEPADFRPW